MSFSIWKIASMRGRPQQTIRHAYLSTLKKLGFEGEKGQLREWMTVARDINIGTFLYWNRCDRT
jgi:hypothetical protein